MNTDEDGYGYTPNETVSSNLTRPQFVDRLPAKAQVDMRLLPPVGTQGTPMNLGSPGSCCAWATVYGLATFHAAQAKLVDPKKVRGQASPAYAYIRVLEKNGNFETCADTDFNDYFDLLTSGMPSMKTAPYFAECGWLWSQYGMRVLPEKVRRRKVFAIHSHGEVPTREPDFFSIKQVLAEGLPLAYGTKLYTDWKDYTGQPKPYVGNNDILIGKNGKPVGHCILLIGYDDHMGKNGAFLIQNSQGTTWGNSGYAWIACETFAALAGAQAFFVLPSTSPKENWRD
jgi:Papain family cysteine protease